MPCSWELYIEREDMQQVVSTLKLHLKSEDHYKANLSHAGSGPIIDQDHSSCLPSLAVRHLDSRHILGSL